MGALTAIPGIRRPGIRRAMGWLGWGSVLLAALLAVPIIVVLGHVFVPSQGTWRHLAQTVLPDYVTTTLLVLAGVAIGVNAIGIFAAWFVVWFRFPGRGFLEWALVLPLAMPAYVMAYAYTDFLQFAGPVQSALREATGWRAREYWFPEVRSAWGAIAMFTFVLYPYVYLIARAAFLEQSMSLIEAGRQMGRGVWGTFFSVGLPLARPAIAAGTSLALMETLADFGTVSYFAVNTFTAGIYRAWYSMGDQVAAAQLAALLLAFVAVLVIIERWNRGRARYYNVASQPMNRPLVLRGWSAWLVVVLCAIPPVMGFLLPALILGQVVWTETEPLLTARFYRLIGNSLFLSAVTAAAAVALAALLAYAACVVKRGEVDFANRVAGLGYAVPGAVIAVGILVPVTRLDNLIANGIEAQFGIKVGLILTGSIAALVYAYLVRFLAVALQTVEAGLSKVRPSMEDAARVLGLTPAQTLARVHAPILRGSLFTAGLMVFVDVMKELPATFAMRPFNFDTLAVQAYNMAKDERLPEAAAASLVIVAVGLVPLILLSRAISRTRGGSGAAS
jgi:iron(III) transport system permease protein